uniref:Uncharacterized protein n=1 Tax=Parascaris equorum TaxID=6256 RepID=A0A914R4E7_PAREQ
MLGGAVGGTVELFLLIYRGNSLAVDFISRIQTWCKLRLSLMRKGYRSVGFSPMNKTPTLLHDHNEYIEESVFLRGVQLYEKIIARLADLPKF